MTTHVRLALIGAGFSGLGMALRLLEAGESDFLLFEREAGVGGTWRVNHYPGCACDVQSHLYSFSFRPNPDWSRVYAPQAEIRAYLERCAEAPGLAPRMHLESKVERIEWDEAGRRWHLTVSGRARGEYTADVVVAGMGGLSTPAFPDIPGLDTFTGPTFHSQRWDHGLDLRARRVAVIGTGASAIQFVPHLQRQAGHVTVHQRTPPWILPRGDRAITDLERAAYRHVPGARLAARAGLYAWLEAQVVAFTVAPPLMSLVRRQALAHLRQQIEDPDLRARLTPDYAVGCKRILISDDYYPALAARNVTLATDGIERIVPEGVVARNGVLHPADVLILGTGFKATDPVPRGVVAGRGGQDLLDAWTRGPEAYKGTTTSGFPNLFFLMGPNTGLGHNSMVYMIESQITYVLDALRQMRAGGLRAVDVRPDAQARYNEALQAKARRAIWSVGGCQSWYLHPLTGRNVTLWPGFTFMFRRETRRFDLEAYDALV